MYKFRWERHEWDLVKKKHVKVNEGHFLAGSLQGAKVKATRQSGMGHGHWRLITAPVAFTNKGRVYEKRLKSRSEYENINPKLLLFVVEKDKNDVA